jgi:hypothetical protein
MTNARDLIMGSGSPAFSFNYPNDTVTGQILTEPKAVQARDFATGQPAFWPSGDPKMQTVFQIQTQLRNYEGINNPDRMRPDDGVRTIYVKGKWMEKATKEAILAARASWLDVGGWISFTYTGDDMTSKAGNKPKLFSVKYQAPAAPPPQAQAQPGYGQQGYPNQGYGQQPPQPPVQAAWQTPGWTPQGPPQFNPGGPVNPPQPVWTNEPIVPLSQPAVPSHHGQPDQMPQWASGPASAPPAPSSAPPAPALSTLDAIRAAQTSGTPDYGSVEPAF